MRKTDFDVEKIREMAANGMTVAAMAVELNADVNDLSKFYITCYSKDQSAYPLNLLVTKSWLEKELASKRIAQICRETNTSFSVIKRLVKLYGISQKPLLKDVLTSEVLFDLFIKQQLSDSTIAERYSCSIETIKKLRAKYNITFENRIDELRIPPIEYYKRLYIDYGFTKEHMSKLIGCKPFQFQKIRDNYINAGHPLSAELKAKKPCLAFQRIIDALFEKVDPVILYEQLKIHTLAEVAEIYEIIPPAEPGVETFSKEWLNIVLHKMNVGEVVDTYLISRTYIAEMMKSENIKPIPRSERLNTEAILSLYIENGWKEEEIAKMFGTTKTLIVSLLRRHGITAKDRKSIGERLNEEKFYELYVKENLTLQQISTLYGVSRAPIIKLKKEYAEINEEIRNHKSGGVSPERLDYLAKQLKFSSLRK